MCTSLMGAACLTNRRCNVSAPTASFVKAARAPCQCQPQASWPVRASWSILGVLASPQGRTASLSPLLAAADGLRAQAGLPKEQGGGR